MEMTSENNSEPSIQTKQWLSLSNYASKYHVSISTLRRRIKNEAVDFKLHEGKYFLLDSEMAHHEKITFEDEPVMASATKLLA